MRAVVTDQGRIACDKLVICAGQWSREIGRMAGVNVPLVSVQHQYLITEAIAGVTSNLPTLRDPDRLTYWKEEVGGLVMGGYEPNPMPWAIDGLSASVRVPACSTTIWTISSRSSSLPRAACRRCRRPASRSSSTGRRASRPTATSSSARRRRCVASMSAPGSTPSASPRAAAPAWRWPNGSPRASRPTISGRSTSGASASTIRHGLGAHAHARGLRQALHHGLAGRGASLAAGRCAARRFTTG